QAEDGIRDFHVTGVQTCALPIWLRPRYDSPITRLSTPSSTRGSPGYGQAGLVAHDLAVRAALIRCPPEWARRRVGVTGSAARRRTPRSPAPPRAAGPQPENVHPPRRGAGARRESGRRAGPPPSAAASGPPRPPAP